MSGLFQSSAVPKHGDELLAEPCEDCGGVLKLDEDGAYCPKCDA